MTIAIENAPALTLAQLIERKAELKAVGSANFTPEQKTEWQQVNDAISRINNAKNAEKMKKFAIACKPLMETKQNARGENVATPGATLTGLILASLGSYHSGNGIKAKDKADSGQFIPEIAEKCANDSTLLDTSVAAAKAIFEAAKDAATTDMNPQVAIVLGVKTSRAGDRTEALRIIRSKM